MTYRTGFIVTLQIHILSLDNSHVARKGSHMEKLSVSDLKLHCVVSS